MKGCFGGVVRGVHVVVCLYVLCFSDGTLCFAESQHINFLSLVLLPSLFFYVFYTPKN